MANPTAATGSDIAMDFQGPIACTQLIVSGEAVVAAQQAAVANVAAITAVNPAALTATNPVAPAAYAAVVNMTDPVTKAEGEAVSAALAALVTSVTAYETVISAAVVDLAAIRAEVIKLVTDVTADKAKINAILVVLEDAGILADA